MSYPSPCRQKFRDYMEVGHPLFMFVYKVIPGAMFHFPRLERGIILPFASS